LHSALNRIQGIVTQDMLTFSTSSYSREKGSRYAYTPHLILTREKDSRCVYTLHLVLSREKDSSCGYTVHLILSKRKTQGMLIFFT